MNNILVLAPHTDDGELGCGGTISKFVKEGKNIYYVAFSTAEESVPEGFPKNILEVEVKKATKILGVPEKNLIIKDYKVRNFPQFRQPILEDLVKIKKEISPDIVFMPSSHDIHQDHKTIYNEAIRAFKDTSMLGYEFMWNSYSFGSTLFSILSRENVDNKIHSLDQYESQAKRLYTKNELIMGQARFRGLQISVSYAEAFEVIRWII